SIAIVYVLYPKAEYLPKGNRNLILGILIPPPGNSVEKRQEIGEYISGELKQHVEKDDVNGVPQIKNFFYVAAPRFNVLGTISHHETRAKEMMPLVGRVINSIPDMFGVGIQVGIFQSDLGGGRSIDVNISGEKMEDITAVATRLFFGGIAAKIPNVQVRPIPGVEIAYPEVSIVPDKRKLAANGLTESEL
ncbi:MAG: efflux RND transporter permease subunit, partial [bacterium]|nr:efflux RND transporter permease subunit [bacterium]